MKNNIKKALKIVGKAADTYQPERYMYEVFVGTDKERLTPHASMETFCEKCIEEAIRDKKRKYFIERQQFMGKIYEYSKRGFYLEPVYRWDKEGNATGIILSKTKDKKHSKDQVIKVLESQLRKKYPASMVFSSECFDLSGSEHDGFQLCESCYVIFGQALILTDQELEHWESCTDKNLNECTAEPSSAYELQKIIDQWSDNPEYCKYQKRLEALADRIVKASSSLI
jgi:hypothetical protein